MTLSLIGGKFKGRRLKSPKSSKTRPTTSIVRKAVFDICKAYIDDAYFLDLFAGTGAMGLEALSRGAAHVTFIDDDRDAIKCLKENISLLDVEKQTAVFQGNALLLMKKLKKPFDIIYVDPPYGKVPLSEILTFFDKTNFINPGGRIFLEEADPAQEDLSELELKRLHLKDSRRFGKTLLHQYEFYSNSKS